MRQCAPASLPLFAGVFAPVLSLDSLCAGRNDESPSFDISDDAPCVEEQLERAQAAEAVDHFVNSLPAREQEIVKRLFWDDQTQTEIAAGFGVSKMAVSKAIARIAKRGRTMLADYQHLTLRH